MVFLEFVYVGSDSFVLLLQRLHFGEILVPGVHIIQRAHICSPSIVRFLLGAVFLNLLEFHFVLPNSVVPVFRLVQNVIPVVYRHRSFVERISGVRCQRIGLWCGSREQQRTHFGFCGDVRKLLVIDFPEVGVLARAYFVSLALDCDCGGVPSLERRPTAFGLSLIRRVGLTLLLFYLLQKFLLHKIRCPIRIRVFYSRWFLYFHLIIFQSCMTLNIDSYILFIKIIISFDFIISFFWFPSLY